MNEQLLTWILPGFIGYFSYQNFRRSIPVHKGNWDFVVSLGIFSVLSTKLAQIFGFDSNQLNSFLFILTASGVALLLGVLFSFIYNILIETKKINNPIDRVTEILKENFEKPIMVTLKSGKIYAGFVMDYDSYSRGESVPDRTLTIYPLLSSRYEKNVISELKFYDLEELKSNVREITFFIREVESIRPFNKDLFFHFNNQQNASFEADK
ncbi:MAG: hypothetical protein L6Q37_03375 [Bdellovibrionaceae bacterium]|nr:hypothetical protein [Pseudobdellovibrionaceae bacterium]